MEKSLSDGLIQRYDKQEGCDVVFLVEEKEIGAHKIVLAIQCQFLNDMAKKWTPAEKPIPLDDINYQSFKDFLRYLYCGELALTSQNAFVFLSTSVRFKLDSLEKMCVDHIVKSMDINNVCCYMNEAVLFGSKLLQKHCLEIFEKKTGLVITSQSFKKLPQPALSAFLDAEKTNILEIALFCNVKSWMRLKCKDRGLAVTGENLREVLGDAIFKIRFPTMTAQDFANSVCTIDGFLSDTEISEIFKMIMMFDNAKIKCPFSNKFRCQRSNFYVPMPDMRLLLKGEVLRRRNEDQSFNMRTMVDHVENLEDGRMMFRGSFHLLAQCCADMANSSVLISKTNQINQDSRHELSKKLQRWEAACTSGEANVSEIMTLFMDFRKELDNLTKWSFKSSA